MESPADRLRDTTTQELLETTTQLCEAFKTLSAESDALCASTKAAVVSAWQAVERHRQLQVRDISAKSA